MLNLPIIDAHVHLWDPAVLAPPWVRGDAVLDRRHDLAAYDAETAGLPIAALVYVQVDVAPEDAPREVELALAYAAHDPRLAGIVAYAPLEQGEAVRPMLRQLAERDPRIKGVRRLLQGEPDPAFCLQPDFVRGVQLLADYGLSFDICVRHHQLASIAELIRRCPATSFVLDHLGKPPVAAGQLDPWRAQLQAIAALPNVCCKLSGLVTEADHAHWTDQDLAPYIRHALDCFGAERVLFGSDWPVLRLAADYRRWITTLDQLTADLPTPARRQLWAENARRVYRLGTGG